MKMLEFSSVQNYNKNYQDIQNVCEIKEKVLVDN